METDRVIEADIHLVELRYSHTRVRDPKIIRQMQHSISQHGQIVPALAIPTKNNRFILIDGYLRLKGLEFNGHDCIKLELLEGSEVDALFTLLVRNNNRQWEAMEEGSIIQELHSHFKYSFGEIGKRLGKDKSWVKRRHDLITGLPEKIKEAVMAGNISTWTASHVLVPLSRVNEKDACQLTEKIGKNPLSTRDLSRLYDHYKKSTRVVRDRIIADPELFIKAMEQQNQEHEAKQIQEGPEGKWMKDIRIVCNILKRLVKTAEHVFYPAQDNKQRQHIEAAEKLLFKLKNFSRRSGDDTPGTEKINPGVRGYNEHTANKQNTADSS